MSRDYPLEKVRNFGIIAPIVAAGRLPENPRFSALPLGKLRVAALLHGKTTVFPTPFANVGTLVAK